MSLSHLIILGLIILLVVPPEKLPEIMRSIGRFVNELKRQTNGVVSQMNDEFKTIKKDVATDIKLTPADMLKKLHDKNEVSFNPTTTSNEPNPKPTTNQSDPHS